MDLASLVYNRLTGLPLQSLDHYKTGLRLWYPDRDFLAFRELRRRKQLTLFRWLQDVARPQVLPFFSWTDPLPTAAAGLYALRIHAPLVGAGRSLRRAASRLAGQFGR